MATLRGKKAQGKVNPEEDVGFVKSDPLFGTRQTMLTHELPFTAATPPAPTPRDIHPICYRDLSTHNAADGFFNGSSVEPSSALCDLVFPVGVCWVTRTNRVCRWTLVINRAFHTVSKWS